MKITCTLQDGVLIPDEKTLKQLNRLHNGVQVVGKLDIEQPRSLPQHCRYWSQLSDFVGSIPEHKLGDFWIAVLHDLVANSVIDSNMVHESIKKIIGITSIAFCNMAQSEANDFFNKADDLLQRWMDQMWEI